MVLHQEVGLQRKHGQEEVHEAAMQEAVGDELPRREAPGGDVGTEAFTAALLNRIG